MTIDGNYSVSTNSSGVVTTSTTVPAGGSSAFYKVDHKTGYNVETNGTTVVVFPSTGGMSSGQVLYQPNVTTNGTYGTQTVYSSPTLGAGSIWTAVQSTTNGIPAEVSSVQITGIQPNNNGTVTLQTDYTPKTDAGE